MSKVIEYEQQIAGALLVNQSWHQNVDLQPGDFLDSTSAIIFEEISRCQAESVAADVFIIADRLQSRTGQNYEQICLKLAGKAVPTEESLKTYSDVVKKQSCIRKAQAIMHEALTRLSEGEDLAIDSAISNLMAIDKGQKKYEWTMVEAAQKAVLEIEAAYNGKEKGIGIKTGLAEFDEKMGGYHKSDLIIVAARPAMGKTTVVMNQMIGSGVRAGFFSSEQGHSQIAQRGIAISGSVPVHNMRNGQLTDDHWSGLMAGVHQLKQVNCLINDNPTITIQEIQRQARKWVQQDGIEIVFVDYAQRIKSANNHMNKLSLMNEVIPALKSLARELDIPVVALAQVKRAVEERSDKRPMMGDIAEASIMEAEADQVITLYRDEVYNQESDQKGVIEFLIEKNRHGPTGRVKAAWRGDCLQVRDLTHSNWSAQQ